MTIDRTLTRSLERMAGEARPVRLPADLWQRGRRRRRRRIAATGAALAVLVAAVAALPLAVSRSGPRAVEPADAPVSVPSTVYAPWPLQRTAQQAPSGPAALLVSGGGPFQGGDLLYRYEDRSMVVGRDGSYRMVRGNDKKDAGDGLLLSPDGRYVASDGGLEGAAGDAPATAVLDLTTGGVRTYAGATPLAWSPEGERLLTHADGALHLLDWQSGQAREVARFDGADGLAADKVAFAPDGRRVAVQAGRILTVVDLTRGTTRQLAELDGDERVAGPAAWRSDGRITLVNAGGCTSACGRADLREREPALTYLNDRSGEWADGPTFGLRGVLGMRLLGWRSSGEPVVAAFKLSRDADEVPESAWPIDGPSWQEDDTWLRRGVRLMVLHDGTMSGTELVRLPDSALQVEVARDLVAAGRFGGPAPSPWDRFADMVLPMTPQLIIVALGLAALVTVRPLWKRVRHRRAGY